MVMKEFSIGVEVITGALLMPERCHRPQRHHGAGRPLRLAHAQHRGGAVHHGPDRRGRNDQLRRTRAASSGIIPRNPAISPSSSRRSTPPAACSTTTAASVPALIYLRDHKAETIKRVVAAAKEFRAIHGTDRAKSQLATGNVGVMAATNEVVAAQNPMVMWVYAAAIGAPPSPFRSWRGALCVIVPLVVVSYLGYALEHHQHRPEDLHPARHRPRRRHSRWIMASTFSPRIQERLEEGESFEDSLCFALTMGTSVMFTGSALAVGVGTGRGRADFQADMGILLSFLFFFNMLGAMLLMPALRRWLFHAKLAHRLKPAAMPGA